MKRIRHQIRFWLPVVMWAAIIFLFSSLQTNKSSEFYWQDFLIKKTAHVVEYAVLTTLTYRALKANGLGKKRSAIYSVGFAVCYAISDEFHQSFTPGRGPTVRDVVFDTIGSLLAIIIIWKYIPKAPKKLRILARDFQLV